MKKKNNSNESKDEFITRLQQEVFVNEAFMELMSAIVEIDYALEKYGYPVEKLNDEKQIAKDKHDYEEVEQISTTLREDFEVSFKEQATILIREIIRISKGVDTELGFQHGKFYLYNGRYWEELDETIFGEFLVEVAIKSSMKYYTVRQPKNKKFLLDSLASQGAIIPVKQDLIRINLLNGTFVIDPKDLMNGSLQDHKPNDGFTYVLDFEFNPEAKAPAFQKFMNEILPDSNTQKVILEYASYCLTDNLHYEKALIAQGVGKNGKSTIQSIIFRLIGEKNISSYSLPKLCDTTGYYRAEIVDKRVNCCGELGSGKIDFDMFKLIVSGENIEGRSPFGRPFNFEVSCKLWFNVNTLPHIESILALKRRLLLVPFKVTIPEDKTNTNLANEICDSELSGIFNLMLEGLVRLVKNGGFTHSEEIDAALDTYMEDNDNVKLFMIDENYEKSSKAKTPREDLYRAYREFCTKNGYTACSSGKFGTRLRNIGLLVERGSQGYYYVDCTKKLTPIEEHNKRIEESNLSPIEKSFHTRVYN